jgi:hypothetical protein
MQISRRTRTLDNFVQSPTGPHDSGSDAERPNSLRPSSRQMHPLTPGPLASRRVDHRDSAAPSTLFGVLPALSPVPAPAGQG